MVVVKEEMWNWISLFGHNAQGSKQKVLTEYKKIGQIWGLIDGRIDLRFGHSVLYRAIHSSD